MKKFSEQIWMDNVFDKIGNFFWLVFKPYWTGEGSKSDGQILMIQNANRPETFLKEIMDCGSRSAQSKFPFFWSRVSFWREKLVKIGQKLFKKAQRCTRRNFLDNSTQELWFSSLKIQIHIVLYARELFKSLEIFTFGSFLQNKLIQTWNWNWFML